MGEAKVRKKAFLAAHPICCFCGGSVPSSTLDHVPNRACFKGRHFPEGFVFPACESCQSISRSDEQIFAFAVRMFDLEPSNFDRLNTQKSITGIANNFPHLLPEARLTANTKRRGLKKMGLSVPHGSATSDIRMLSLDVRMNDHIARYVGKIGLALFYRETGRIAPINYRIWSTWTQASNQHQMKGFMGVAAMAPTVHVGYRPNVDLGNQFGYRCNRSDGSEDSDCFVAVVQFGLGLVISITISDPTSWAQISDTDDSVAVADLFTNLLES